MRWINARPRRSARIALALVPFVLLAIAYAVGSAVRLEANPNDKLLPALSSFAAAIDRLAFTANVRTGEYVLWSDTAASLVRLLSGLGIASLVALILGLSIGVLPYVRALLAPIVNAISMVPPLALLPILFIVMGLGEASKIALIAIGTAPILIRDTSMRALQIPTEEIVKAQTLGANSWLIAIRVVLPQIMPRLIDAVRLQLGPAWLFLIAAEAISSDSGLGYRIFLVRRYLAMDVIFPYVLWITLLAVAMDFALDQTRRRAFRWTALEGGS